MGAVRSLINNTFTSIPDTSCGEVGYFFNSPQNSWVFSNPFVPTSAGNVYLNFVKLALNNYGGLYLYIDTTGTLNLKNNINWQVTGAGSIPAFTYSSTLPWLSYAAYAQLPDTIFKTSSTVINLGGISGADSLNVNIDDGTYISGHILSSGKVVSTTPSVTFLKTSTNSLTNTNTGKLTVSIYKFASVQTFGGKNFVFYYNVQFSKVIVIL